MLKSRKKWMKLLFYSVLGWTTLLQAASVRDPINIRIYVSGESVEEFNHMNLKSFKSDGSLNEESNNSRDEYGWMPPFAEKLLLRDPKLSIEWVGSTCWSDQNTWECSTGLYTNSQIGHTSAEAGSTIVQWQTSHRNELIDKEYCYDIAFASRGGNDLDEEVSTANYETQLRQLIQDLDQGSNCQTHPIIYVTAHLLDSGAWNYGYTQEAIDTWMNQQHSFYVETTKRIASELNVEGRHVRFLDMWTPFYDDKKTTAFPSESWWFVNDNGVKMPNLDKIHRDSTQHPRRLASIFAGENVANQIDIAELRSQIGDSSTIIRNDNAYKLDINLTGSLQNPAFSPDNNSIVFTRFRNGYNQEPADLFIFDLKKNTLKELVSNNFANINLPGSVWNAELNAITFASTRDPHDEIYMINADSLGQDEIKITQRDNFVAYEPSFNPKGTAIVFESHPLDIEDHGVITTYEIDGASTYRALTSANEDARQPNWSPSGDKILYQKFTNSQWDIWTMDTDGTHQLQVTSGEGSKTDASFSYDGEEIIYSFETEEQLANIYSINLKTDHIKAMTNFEGYDGAPSLSSDRKNLVFESSQTEPDRSEGTEIWMIERVGNTTENVLTTKTTHTLSGTFGHHDFANVESAFDWVFTTQGGVSYQLMGQASSNTDVFGWKEADGIDTPTPAWYMFTVDLNGDGKQGKFEWILLSTNMKNKAAYELVGSNDNGTFKYSDKLDIDYNIEGSVITTGDLGTLSHSWRTPSLKDSWQWQLSGKINTNYDVDAYEVDLFESSQESIDTLHSKNIYVICYFSAGSYEDWREDKDLFDASVIGNDYDGWAGESWLDIRTQNVKDIMRLRLDRAMKKKCDAVEADNVHGFEEETGFNLTAQDQLTFNRFLASEAHSRSMGIALKNDSTQAKGLVNDFDFAVTEELFQLNEQNEFKVFIDAGKPVFNAEYHTNYVTNQQARIAMCQQSNALGYHTLILPLDLDDSFRYDCYINEGSTDTKATISTFDSKSTRWFYYLGFEPDSTLLKQIAESSYDMIVIEALLTTKEYTKDVASLIQTIKKKDASKRVLAYVDIGQAEEWRTYWQEGWQIGSPKWIVANDPDGWSGNYPVAFWDKAWREIWLGETGYLQQIIDAGYDGIYMDWIEAYSDDSVIAAAQESEVNATMEMIRFVSDISIFSKSRKSSFLLIAQNAAELAEYESYVKAVDAIAQEQTWFDGSSDNIPPGDCPLPRTNNDIDTKAYTDSLSTQCFEIYTQYPKSTLHVSSEEYIYFLNLAKSKGVDIFTVDYATQENNIEWVYKHSRELGYIPFVSQRALNIYIDPR